MAAQAMAAMQAELMRSFFTTNLLERNGGYSPVTPLPVGSGRFEIC
jgi:hypothetical protein